MSYLFSPNKIYYLSKLHSEKAHQKKQERKINDEIKRLKTEIEDIKSNKIYENAFEWRFEFPEVLNDDGEFVGFDIVIGNPPYIPGKDMDNAFKTYLKTNYQCSIGKFDMYLSFIEKGLEIVTKNKNLCFIVPNTLLANENASLLREQLVNKQLLNVITVLDETVFSEAFVESIVLQLDNLQKRNSLTLQDKNFHLMSNIAFDKIQASQALRIPVLVSETDDSILNKISSTSIKLGDKLDLCIGIQIGGEGSSKEFKSRYISEEKLSDDYKKMIDGKDFEPYKIIWPHKYIKYGNWLHRKRDDKYFLNTKIIIRQIGETPVATLDFDSYFTLNTIYNGILKDNEYDIKYIFALINSGINKYIWKKRFYDGKSLFPKIKKSQLIEIPIAKATIYDQSRIVKIVDAIYDSKISDPNADTSALEKEIDQLVYKLYDLTDEDIAIVEGKDG